MRLNAVSGGGKGSSVETLTSKSGSTMTVAHDRSHERSSADAKAERKQLEGFQKKYAMGNPETPPSFTKTRRFELTLPK
jgi:hypothetical protein